MRNIDTRYILRENKLIEVVLCETSGMFMYKLTVNHLDDNGIVKDKTIHVNVGPKTEKEAKELLCRM